MKGKKENPPVYGSWKEIRFTEGMVRLLFKQGDNLTKYYELEEFSNIVCED